MKQKEKWKLREGAALRTADMCHTTATERLAQTDNENKELPGEFVNDSFLKHFWF